MGFFSKATDDVADATKDVAEDKMDDVVEATGMEDNTMAQDAADKVDDHCEDESCDNGTCCK